MPALPPLTQRALFLPSLPRPRPAHHPPPPLHRRGHVKQEPNSEILARFADVLHCDELLPPPDAQETNWLKQAGIKKQWQTKRIEQLEEQCVRLQGELAKALAMNATKDQEIAALHEQVRNREPHPHPPFPPTPRPRMPTSHDRTSMADR